MKKSILLAAVVAILFCGCAKDGETGPAGPAGANGNANVRSKTFTVNPSDWVVSGTSGSNYLRSYDFSDGDITQSILDKGSIMVYQKQGGSYIQMPYTIPALGSVENIQYSADLYQLEIALFLNNFAAFTVTAPIEFKVVVIAGS